MLYFRCLDEDVVFYTLTASHSTTVWWSCPLEFGQNPMEENHCCHIYTDSLQLTSIYTKHSNKYLIIIIIMIINILLRVKLAPTDFPTTD